MRRAREALDRAFPSEVFEPVGGDAKPRRSAEEAIDGGVLDPLFADWYWEEYEAQGGGTEFVVWVRLEGRLSSSERARGR